MMTATPRRILAIDDSLTIRKLLERTLQMAGYALELAPTGKDGVERAVARPPDLVLLDYVLPDMRGIDVCEHILKSLPNWNVPIVLMSAKSQDIRASFSAYPAVVDYIGKPFSPSDILFHVQRAIGPALPPQPEKPVAPPSESVDHIAAAAKVIYGVLKNRFAQIPDWYPQLQGASPSSFFGPRILTSKTVEQLLTALKDVYATGAHDASIGTPPNVIATPVDVALQGETTLMPLLDLFQQLRTRGVSGMLRVKQEGRLNAIYWRRGDIVIASHNQPDNYVQKSPCKMSTIPGDELKRAMAIQVETLKPVFVTLAEGGSLPSADLPQLLRHHGQEVLLEMLEGGPGRFSLHYCDPLPDYAEAHGVAISLEQLKLSLLRRVDDWSQVELRVGKLDMIFWRTDNFSKKLLPLDLNDVERRVLTLVDGRNRVSTIIERAAYSPFEVFHALFCMSQIGLIRKDRRHRDASASGQMAAITARPIFIVEPDEQGIVKPLEVALLSRWPNPLCSLTEESNFVERMVKETPKLVLLNASSPAFDAEKIARDVRSRIEISDITLAAILDKPDAARQESLRAAGFNVVWVKPFLLRDVELLLAS